MFLQLVRLVNDSSAESLPEFRAPFGAIPGGCAVWDDQVR